MAWTLQIVPKGLLLSKFLKNDLIINTDSVKGIERNSLINDEFQTFNKLNNTININFQLNLFNDSPENIDQVPEISGINYIIISNDPEFKEIVVLTPEAFINSYDFQTDYVVDLSPYGLHNQVLPLTQSVLFTESTGTGIICLRNWVISGSSGLKKIYIKVSVLLVDGTSAEYPYGYRVFDEITVASNYVSSPTKPSLLGRTKFGHSSTPVYLKTSVVNNVGLTDVDDFGMASYFWDALILTTPTNLSRSNYSDANIVLFKSSSVGGTLDAGDLPIVFNGTATIGLGSTASYSSYIPASNTNINETDNIVFFESFIKTSSLSFNYINNPVLFYEINILDDSSALFNIKILRQQIVINLELNNITIYTSIDDYSWGSSGTYIPSAIYSTKTISNPELVAQMIDSGTFVLLVECINVDDNIYQSKLMFKPNGFENMYVINEALFASTSMSSVGGGTDIYFEFRHFARNATSQVILQSVQYGKCRGSISAATIPSDKVLTNLNYPVENNLDSLYDSEEINSWYIISNSPTSGSVNESNGSVLLFNNTENDSQSNLSSIEIQSSIPTFSEDSTFTVTFSAGETLSNINSLLKTAYSLDLNLDYSDFTFNDLLKTESGMYIPQSIASYNYSAFLNWSGISTFSLNVHDLGSAQTCSISTTKTDNLFFYSKPSYSGALNPPVIIQTIENIGTTKTLNAWFTPTVTSDVIGQKIIVKNQGNNPITIGSSLGLSTIVPGQPYVLDNMSSDSANPTSITIFTPYVSASSSVNFLYDFCQLGEISSIGLTIQIVDPPECPSLLPSFKYSIEVSEDFITWVYLTDTTVTETFNPNTGCVTLSFDTPNNSGDEGTYRFARLRLYYDASATFDPRQIWRYSLLNGSQNVTAEDFVNSGKLVFGFTDQGAKDIDLGQLYNQPTYLRQFVTNSSFVAGLVADFSDYDNSINGPVHFSLLTQSSETKFKTIENNFDLETDYTISLVVERKSHDGAFRLSASVAISGGDLSGISYNLGDILSNPSSVDGVSFGYYPFISLIGNGKFSVNPTIIKGTYNHNTDRLEDNSYFSILGVENADYTGVYAKNCLVQNTFRPVNSSYPCVYSYFTSNTNKKYLYENISFTVKAASTSALSLYGTIYVDGTYLTVCDYVLVAGQQNKNDNGVYQVQNKQWVKQLLSSQPTILVSEGNVFGDTLWMRDATSGDWIPNIVICPFVLDDNNLLFTGISSVYKYPQFVKIGVAVSNISDVNLLDKVKLKIANSPNINLNVTDLVTQWNSVFQNGVFYDLNSKDVSNNTVFLNFAIPRLQIQSISTNAFPAIYNLIVSYCGNYQPMITENSDFVLPNYGNDYRAFVNSKLIYQLFSTYESVDTSSLNSSMLNSGVYGLSVDGQKTLQSGFSTDIVLDTLAPTVGILSRKDLQVKSVLLGLSTVYDIGSGLSIARVVQKTPSNDTVYGSWFGFSTSSFAGVSSIYAYPSYITNIIGVTTGEPLSGYYRYSLQVADRVGNVAQSNEVESFYYETAIIDTQGPFGAVNFVDAQSENISITSSSLVTAKLLALDSLSGVKAFRYRILPEGEFTNWMDYSETTTILLPDGIGDGILSLQFQFKDYGNNVLYTNSTLVNDKVYVYTWNIISRLISNTLFTVTETTTFDDRDVLIIGGSKNGSATLYTWDNFKLLELEYTGFGDAASVTAMKVVDDTVVIGTDIGQILLYQNGIISGPYEIFNWGGTGLPISSFEVHKYPTESVEYIYATTVNTPRIFRTSVEDLRNLTWEVVQTPPITLTKINVLNSGLWSGNSISYSISSSFVPATLSPTLSYGISTVIVGNRGSNYVSTPTITFNGPISSASLSPLMQGYVGKLNLFTGGVGYTAGATVAISSPYPGGDSIQATGYAVTNSNGQIISVGVTSSGYGYTQTPTVTITGVSNYGRDAVATATVTLDSIRSISVVSAGIATTTSVALSVSGSGTGAQLTPTFLYRISSIDVTNPGFGYTSTPVVSINGLTTLATAEVESGSIQSITVTGTAQTFLVSQPASISLIGGVSTSWIGTIYTDLITFTSSGGLYQGIIITAITVTSSGQGIATVPYIYFNSSIFDPTLEYVYSNDLILSQGNQSIYDIKSFDEKLFFTSSTRDIIELGYEDDEFITTRRKLDLSSSKFEQLTPEKLAINNDGTKDNLYFSTKEEPFVGKLSKENKNTIFDTYQNNILSFKPYNFDIISDWQLVKILNSNGIGTATYADETREKLLISTTNSFVYYQSTKNNTWVDRCQTSNSWMIAFVFRALSGTQCAEIYSYNFGLQVAFTAYEDTLIISYGLGTYSTVVIDEANLYEITFIKNNNDLYIYNGNTLIKHEASFFVSRNYQPIIKFGYIFEPNELIVNGETQSLFGAPSTLNNSEFIWYQIKFSFDTTEFDANVVYYELSLPYTMPNSALVRALRSFDGELFAATKSIYDTRYSSIPTDYSSKVFRLDNNTWADVTGQFEPYSYGVNTSYVLTSPIDLGKLNDSYFVTGLTKPAVARASNQASILLGLSTSIAFEEEDLYLTVIYPYNPNNGGKKIYLSSSSPYLTLPSNIHFRASDTVKSLKIGMGSTSDITPVTITATDNSVSANATLQIIPMGISSIGLNTSSFTGFSLDPVIATVTFFGRVRTPRVFYIRTNNTPVLSIPNSGLSTLPAGAISTSYAMAIGVATTGPSQVVVTASYRNSIVTSHITVNPFIISLGLNTASFVGNQLYGSVIATATVQSAPKSNLRVNMFTGLSTVLSSPSFINVLTGTLSTSVNLTVGFAASYVHAINVTGFVTGGISTAQISAYYYYIATATTDNSRPILGLQTSTVTYTLNTTPTNDVWIYNVIQSPGDVGGVGISVTSPIIVLVRGGSISTSFGVSTTIQPPFAIASGLGVTVQGAPFGFNTTPAPGLTMVSDVWRITSLQVTPSSIVGGGGQVNGIAQSFIILATTNYVGLATTVLLTTNSSFIRLGTTLMQFLNGSATSIGYATGLTTSVTSVLNISALGPNWITTSSNLLTLDPFLISSFSTTAVWAGGFDPRYTISGVGATVVGEITLNAYPLALLGVQTVTINSPNTQLFIYGQSEPSPRLGLCTVNVGTNKVLVNFGVNTSASIINGSVVASVVASTGIATTNIVARTFQEYYMEFEPQLPSNLSQIHGYLNAPLPVNVGISVQISNGQSLVLSVSGSSVGVSSGFTYNPISFDTSFSAVTSLLGIVQTYYNIGYAKSGNLRAVGYNYYGELTRNYPVSGSTGSELKVKVASGVVKVASGSHHNLILTNTGKVYAVGDNTYNQCGFSNALGLSTSTFKLVEFNKKAKSIYAQNNTSYVLLSDNKLYAFGSNNLSAFGAASFTGVSTHIPVLVSSNVRFFSAYNDRGVIVTQSNTTGAQSIYEFGRGSNQVGKGITQVNFNGEIRNISAILINDIDCGPYHTAAISTWRDTATGVTSLGAIAWGDNRYYQTGTAITSDYVTIPNVLHYVNSMGTNLPIADPKFIVADYNSTLVITTSVGAITSNIVYLIGSASSANNTGTGVGISQTNIARAFTNTPFIGSLSTSLIYKISKGEDHFVWITGLGSAYVTGGNYSVKLDRNNYYKNANYNERLLLAPQNYFYDGSESNTTIGIYANNTVQLTSVTLGYSDAEDCTKFIAPPPRYFGNILDLNFCDNFSAGVGMTTTPGHTYFIGGFYCGLRQSSLDVFYGVKSPFNPYNSYLFNSSDDMDSLEDATIGWDLSSAGLGTAYAQKMNILAVKQDFNGVTTSVLIKHLIGVTSHLSLGETLIGPFSYSFTRTAAPTKIDASYVSNFKGTNVVIGSTNFEWYNSSYNFVVGYNNGLIELYGNAYSYGLGMAASGSSNDPVFISSWSVDSRITCMQSIVENVGYNHHYLIVATISGYLYSYRSRGVGSYDVMNSQTESTLTLLGSRQLSSTYGYVTKINTYITGSFIAITSNGYMLVVNNIDLSVIAAVLLSVSATSLYYNYAYNSSGQLSTPNLQIITTGVATNYQFSIQNSPDYEMGLGYKNVAGSYQLITTNGFTSGLGYTSVFAGSTSDTFTMLLDSN